MDGSVVLNIFDGTRQPYSDSKDLLITVRDGNQHVVSTGSYQVATVNFTKLPVFNNLGDNYTFLASAGGYKDAGFFPVHIASNITPVVDLMLVPKSNELNFAQAKWNLLKATRPITASLLAQGAADDNAAGARYSDLEDEQDGEILACLLNITTAMEQIHLPQRTVLEYLKMVRWELQGDFAMAEDRFYAWVDPAIIAQIEQAKLQKKFVDAPVFFHPGATRSYKQTEFGEANVQLTFHENTRQMVGGVNCVLLEPDVDYYKDAAAHLLLEVAVNAFGSITDPRAVYALRWIAGRRAGIPEFNPLYTIQKA